VALKAGGMMAAELAACTIGKAGQFWHINERGKGA